MNNKFIEYYQRVNRNYENVDLKRKNDMDIEECKLKDIFSWFSRIDNQEYQFKWGKREIGINFSFFSYFNLHLHT